jgi:hypothetical protein
MNELSIIVLLSLALCAILLRLLIPKKKATRPAGPPFSLAESSTLPAARHYGYFPQIRQALSEADAQYLLESAPPQVAKRALRERRAVARGFLKGLHEDFSNLARLGRLVAAMSPEISHRQETERLLLSMKFQLLYTLVWLRLSIGNLPIHQLENLTGLVGRLATRMDEAMAQISALSVGQLPGKLGA